MFAINLCYKVPNEKVDEIAAVINEHAAFMQKLYVDKVF